MSSCLTLAYPQNQLTSPKTASPCLNSNAQLKVYARAATLIPMVLGNLQEATFLHSVQLCSSASGAVGSVNMSFFQQLNSGILT